MRIGEVQKPRTLEEALEILGDHPDTLPLAGGTDLLVKVKDGLVSSERVLDLSSVAILKGIRSEDNTVGIGALTTLGELEESPLVRRLFPCLVRAAAQVGSVQIRNRATLGGNLVNASPAADTVPALLVLGARLVLWGPDGKREVPVEEFFLGPGKTVLETGELLSEILLPVTGNNTTSGFEKVGKRNAQAISVANGAFLLEYRQTDGGVQVIRCRLAAGSVAPTAVRLANAESVLEGKALTEGRIAEALSAVRKDIRPITDLRASARYRTLVTENIFRRMLLAALQSVPQEG